MPDCGNLHVIDYYLYHSIVLQKPIFLSRRTERVIDFQSDFEFDVATERREGYAYDNL